MFKVKKTFEYFANGSKRVTEYRDGSNKWSGISTSGIIKDDMQPIKVETYEDEELLKFEWCKQWKELEEKDQEIIWAVFGKDSLREKFKNEIETLKNPKKIYSSALSFLYKRGLNKECTRCGGTGHFSYCQRFGTMCFKCSGKKLQMVMPTKAQVKKWIKNHPEGLKYANIKELGKGKIFIE